MILGTNTDIKENLFLDGNKIEKFQKVFLVRITFDDKLSFKTHIERICRTVKYNLHALQRLVILINFLKILFVFSFISCLARFSKFECRNVILFQIKNFGRNIKETALTRYFIKVTACPNFARLKSHWSDK